MLLRRAKAKTKRSLPTSPTEYPDGTFIHTERGYFYIVAPGKRYSIMNRRLLDSWAPVRVVETTEAAVSHYKTKAKMKFRNGSLIHNLADGKIYLIVQGKRCHITSPDVFERIGARGTREDVISVSLAEINLHEEGTPIG